MGGTDLQDNSCIVTHNMYYGIYLLYPNIKGLSFKVTMILTFDFYYVDCKVNDSFFEKRIVYCNVT